MRKRDIDRFTFEAKIHGVNFEVPSQKSAPGVEVDDETQKAIDEHLKNRQREKFMEMRTNG